MPASLIGVKKLLTKHQHYLQIVLLLLVLLACSWTLLQPGLGSGHDLHQAARTYELATALQEGNFPVIWSQNYVFGYGMPLFEFYAPLPYYLSAGFYLLGFDLTTAVELMILFLNVVTVLGAYLLGKNLWQNRWAGILVAAALALAPYRAVDLMVRTALSEAWAIAFLPWILLAVIGLVEGKRWSWLILTLSLSALFLSHNLTALIALPFLLCFTVFYVMWRLPQWRQRFTAFWRLLPPTVLSLVLTSFYLFPMWLEKSFTQIDQFVLSSYFDYRQHFLYIRQLLEPWGAWEYGGSGWGPNDEMSFFLGYGQLLILVLTVLCSAAALWRKKYNKVPEIFLAVFLLFLVGGSLFLTLLKAQFIWQQISFSNYIQFPWRYLSLAIIFIALLAGFVYGFLSRHWRGFFFIIVYTSLLLLNWRYFQNEKSLVLSEDYADMAMRIRTSDSRGLYDYLPVQINFLEKSAFFVDKNPELVELEVPVSSLVPTALLTDGQLLVVSEQSSRKLLEANLEQETTLSLNLAYYPGWQVKVEGRQVAVGADEYGRLTFTLPAGTSQVEVNLGDTPVRRWSKIVSVLGLLILLYFTVKEWRERMIPIKKRRF